LAIPVAFGELVDKITILEIKAERLTDKDKLKNVRHELDLLRAAYREIAMPTATLDKLSGELKRANASLRDLEDEIRDCEPQGEFGSRFIELARSVYKTNERRSYVKR